MAVGLRAAVVGVDEGVELVGVGLTFVIIFILLLVGSSPPTRRP